MIHASQYSHLCIQTSLSFKHASVGFYWLLQNQQYAVKVMLRGFQGFRRSLTT